MTSPKSQFTEYIDDQLERRGWNLTDLAEYTGLASSVIFRYRRGYRPTIDNARTLAHTLEVPLLEVLVATGVISQDEAHYGLSAADQRTVLSGVSTVTLAQEQLARAEAYEKVQRDYDAQQADLSRFASTLEHLSKHAALRLEGTNSRYRILDHDASKTLEAAPEDAPEDFDTSGDTSR